MSDADFDQVARLNHGVFCQEVGQHPVDPGGLRVDPRHAGNVYVVGCREAKIVAMVAFSFERPFSLEAHLDLDPFLSEKDFPVEIRLLAVHSSERRFTVLPRLLVALWSTLESWPWTVLLIKGIQTRFAIYEKLGFEPFSSPIAERGEQYQPALMRRDGPTPFANRLLYRF